MQFPLDMLTGYFIEQGIAVVKEPQHPKALFSWVSAFLDQEAPAAAEGEAVSGTLTVTVGEEAVEVAVMDLGSSNYVSAEGLAALLGLDAQEADGVLTLAVPVNTGIGG